ncbi:MAG: hypothetical protein M3R02_12345 [Chloroflexota bacterium]|nr:hypothetical protein [Chloroflexota bacterium]
MPEGTKEFFRPIGSPGDTLRVRITIDRGEVTAFVIQYEAWIEGAHRPVVRYDTAHGKAHRDMLDWNGSTIDKVWAWEGADLSYNEALDSAASDLINNWAAYREDFLRRKP